MKRFALNFICKNESHVILRMLESVRPITDLIVASDTGSTDDTIAVIRQFGARYGIPTYVFERPFDNFGNARNHALDKLLETVDAQGWERGETYGFWLDCDEEMVFNGPFSKEDMILDVYHVHVVQDGERQVKDCFFRLDKNIRWEGPIHEYLAYDSQQLTVDFQETVMILYYREGATWKGDLESKFLNYALKLREYVNDGHRCYRWLWYEAGSYRLAADYCDDAARKQQYFEVAMNVYEEAFSLEDLIIAHRYLIRFSQADVLKKTNAPWKTVKAYFLKAYLSDKRSPGPFLELVGHYREKRQLYAAHIYSEFAVQRYDSRDTSLEASWAGISIYKWKLLFLHYEVLLESDVEQARKLYEVLLKRTKNPENYFMSPEDVNMIAAKSPANYEREKRAGALQALLGKDTH